MTNFKELVSRRRSCRAFTDLDISPNDLNVILRAALMAPTSKGRRSWQFIVVDDPILIESLAYAKDAGAQFLKEAPLAIVVLGDPAKNDCWIEDCSIAAVTMQYQAEELGLSSCWAQMRGRGLADGTTADEVIHDALSIPDDLSVLCVLGIGYKATERRMQKDDRLKWENIHINHYRS